MPSFQDGGESLNLLRRSKMRNMNENLLHTCKNLSELARIIYGNANYTNREKVKNDLRTIGVNWEEWLESKKRQPNHCLYCGKEIIGKDKYRKIFCDRSCANKHNNALKRINKKCLVCGKDISPSSTFCSNTCYAEFEYRKYIERWKEGKESGMSGSDGMSDRLRRYMLEKTNYTCEVPGCGCNFINPYTNLSILQIHHIDGDATNNKEENLQVLCPNHHAMTEHFGSRNKNSTRRYRYSKGK